MDTADKKFALLIDIASIQRYIFTSNRLAINIGASYIVENKLFGNITGSQDERESHLGYQGGGNALFLFEDSVGREQFLHKYRKEVLSNYPGTKVAYGMINDFDGESKFSESMKALHVSLRRNRNLNHTNHFLPQHGLSKKCTYTGEAVADYQMYNEWVSTSAKYKLDAAEHSTKKYHNIDFNDIIGTWRFTNEIDQLGQPNEKSYIAVVHVDGNGIGNEFRNSQSLEYTKELSKEVKNLGRTIMKKMIVEVVKVADQFVELPGGEKRAGFDFKDDGENKILPIRPILAGGDDFTFVCEGKLGVYLAQKMIQLINDYDPDNEKFKEKESPRFNRACAGIAIVPTKFPFYKAYQLAEELCQKAKVQSRKDNNHSYLSFMLFRRNTTKDLEDLVHLQYFNEHQYKIHYHTTYKISNDQPSASNKSWQSVLDVLKAFHTSKTWSNSRIMSLRDALYGTEDELSYFITLFNARKSKKETSLSINQDDKIYYHDAIELYDFYPKELLGLDAETEKTTEDANL